MAKDDDLLPKKRVKTGASKSSSSSSSSSSGPSVGALRFMRGVHVVGLLLGAFVSLVFVMALVGKFTNSFLVRIIVGLVVVIALPTFIADRVLRKRPGGLALIGNIFTIVLLGFSLFVVGAEFLTRDLLRDEGDRYARSGSRFMARVVYRLGAVYPVFPDERAANPPPTTSGTIAPDAGVK